LTTEDRRTASEEPEPAWRARLRQGVFNAARVLGPAGALFILFSLILLAWHKIWVPIVGTAIGALIASAPAFWATRR
jgi:glycerol uptake facilitator-like aquaporin